MSFWAGFVEDFTQSIITILVIINPLGAVPFFQGLTVRATAQERAAVARRAPVIAAAVLLVFAYLGDIILTALSIDLSYVSLSSVVRITSALRRTGSSGS